MLTITLPEHNNSTRVAGIRFTDRQATVPDLGPHARRFFTAIGATFTAPESTVDPLTTHTVAELRELAVGLDIEVPSKATKQEIIDLLNKGE